MNEAINYNLFPTFEAVVDYLDEQRKGSYYEQRHGLTPRCFFGRKWSEEFGTISYVTDDGRVALLWAFQLGNRNAQGWFYIYPSDPTLMYFLKKCPEHIEAVLTNNSKAYKIRGETMSENKINWDDFQSKFLTIEPGDTADVKLTNWRQEQKTFMDSEKAREALVFDVIKVDNKDHYDAPLEWSTTSASLAQEFRPMIEKAEAGENKVLSVRMKRGKDKRYMVVDLTER